MAFDRYDTIALGQDGSAFLDSAATLFIPVAPLRVVAITCLTDCTFTDLVADDNTKFIGTGGAGKGGDTFAAADVIPAGVTIYGSWVQVGVGVNGEKCICYVG
jgi:hypothetical protein